MLMQCLQVEFKVNDVKQDYSMKLGEGGEAFFVFETFGDIPEALQTSPLVSPSSSPKAVSAQDFRDSTSTSPLQEPDYLDLTTDIAKQRPASSILQPVGGLVELPERRAKSDVGMYLPPKIWKGSLLRPQQEMPYCSLDQAVQILPNRMLKRGRPLLVLHIERPLNARLQKNCYRFL